MDKSSKPLEQLELFPLHEVMNGNHIELLRESEGFGNAKWVAYMKNGIPTSISLWENGVTYHYKLIRTSS